jgi:hypothetical protein
MHAQYPHHPDRSSFIACSNLGASAGGLRQEGRSPVAARQHLPPSVSGTIAGRA